MYAWKTRRWPWALPFHIWFSVDMTGTRWPCMAKVHITSWARLFLLFRINQHGYIYAYRLLKLRVESKKYFCHINVYSTTNLNLQMQPFAHLLRFQATLRLLWGVPFMGSNQSHCRSISVSKCLSSILTCASKCVSTVCVVLWPPSSAISRYLRSCEKKVSYTPKLTSSSFHFLRSFQDLKKEVTIQMMHFAFYSYI